MDYRHEIKHFINESDAIGVVMLVRKHND